MKGNRTKRITMKKFQVWLPFEDYEMLTKVATYERLSYSNWTRQTIAKALRRASRSLPNEGENE